MGKIVHNNYITVAKAIGIILMVIGHSGCPALLFRFIYLFHMPLFFFCSGIFFKEIISKDNAFVFLKKRFVGLYVPFVKWSVFFLLIHNLLILVGIYNSQYGFEGGSLFYGIKETLNNLGMILFTMHGYDELLGGFWFIRALFLSSLSIVVFSILLRKVPMYNHELMCLIFLLLTVLIRRYLNNTELWSDMSMGTFGALFFIVGNLQNQYGNIWKNKYVLATCSLTLMLSMFYFGDVVKMECGYNKVIPYAIAAISGILAVLFFSYALEKKASLICPVMYYIGNHTLLILALHFLCFRLVSVVLVFIYNIDFVHVAEHPVIQNIDTSIGSWWWMLYAFAGISIPLLLKYGIDSLISKVR
ncbi:acyltransferase family protein [Prevotella communis]|uniref:acyltransferase family protein n=1 Tax=Prevotella communis TaxID=2913614 RepID=UPI001EDC252E|nr:acyltransferase family protein [Prevotella communis]UKK61052.1 acyltransferase family protein [Prevotella communis]UKK63877.1 acyltransferase family protein [Prevotella communis]